MDSNRKEEFLLLTLHSFLENSPDMIFAKDMNLVYVAASRTFAEMMGCKSGDELVGKTDFDIFPPALAEKYTKDDRALLDSETNIEDYIEPLPDFNGKKSFSSTSKYLIRDTSGNVIGLYGVGRDITAQMELEAERESSRLSRQLFDDVLEADLTKNRMLCVEGAKWGRMLDITDQFAFTDAVDTVAKCLVHPDYALDFSSRYSPDKLKDDYQQGIREFNHTIYLRSDSGSSEYHWVECCTRVYYSRVSKTLRVTTFLRDVDNDVRSKQQLQMKASTDALTGLLNRSAILEEIVQFLMRGSGSQMYALLFIDLDSFKQANDRWGHRFGDKVLRETAERLRDLLAGLGICGRIGGDEFLVFLPDVQTRLNAEQWARKVVQALLFSYNRGGEEINVTCSVGVTLCNGNGVTAEHLCEQADRAMYRAKEKGRNQLFFYQDLST